MKQKIAVHIISGFLGAGKTSFLNQLFSNKGSDKKAAERWVVILNEAGKTQYEEQQLVAQGIIVKALYGGCLCCSAAMTFRVALNKIIKEHQPQRIFIEPAGAGHLANIKRLLQGEFYEPILTVQGTLCLLTHWQLQDPTFSNNALYLALIEQADKLCFYEEEALPLATKMASKYAKPLHQLQHRFTDLLPCR